MRSKNFKINNNNDLETKAIVSINISFVHWSYINKICYLKIVKCVLNLLYFRTIYLHLQAFFRKANKKMHMNYFYL